MGTCNKISRIIENYDKPDETPGGSSSPVTIIEAVNEYLADAKARELADATLYKLEIQLRKQFLGWGKAEGYKLLKELIFEQRSPSELLGKTARWPGRKSKSGSPDSFGSVFVPAGGPPTPRTGLDESL